MPTTFHSRALSQSPRSVHNCCTQLEHQLGQHRLGHLSASLLFGHRCWQLHAFLEQHLARYRDQDDAWTWHHHPSDDESNVKYTLKGFSLQDESASFGDGSYRAMVDQRMATRKPLMVPFYIWAGFESSTQVTNINQQFTIGTESLNAILASIRPGMYDSTVFRTGNSIGGTPQTTGNAMSNANWFIPQQGGSDPRATSTPILVPEFAVNSWYYTFLFGEKPTIDQFGPNGTFSAKFPAEYRLKVPSFWRMYRMPGT